MRLRSLIALLSREIFGVELAIPDFPVLKGIRGFGMSDPPELAQRLAEKFEYTNTFYHQEPRLDIADPSPEHLRNTPAGTISSCRARFWNTFRRPWSGPS